MPSTILVLDDEKDIADLVTVYLDNEGYDVVTCYDPTDALAIVAARQIDLAILDVMMPGMSGFDVLHEIRKNHTFPIIMLTAKEGETDQINGLSLGADDYVTKPFRPLELVARVKAQLRRAQRYGGAPADESIAIAGLVIDKRKHEATLDGAPLTLTPMEFDILWLLCSKQGEVVTSEELFEKVWGEKYFTNISNTVMVHIRHLREKLGDSADKPRYIKTVWGVGYKIER